MQVIEAGKLGGRDAGMRMKAQGSRHTDKGIGYKIDDPVKNPVL
jgi:hypothetical protein